jgi:hypothetical protein
VIEAWDLEIILELSGEFGSREGWESGLTYVLGAVGSDLSFVSRSPVSVQRYEITKTRTIRTY